MKFNRFPIRLSIILVVIVVIECISGYYSNQKESKKSATFLNTEHINTVWRGWNKSQIKTGTDSGDLIMYGYELIANTAYYLGPKGTVARITNGMNCQNCHLNGGTVPYGNNFGKVYATYPQFRARKNGFQSIYDRINDCLLRSLNGSSLDSATREMQAIYAYIKWLGAGVPTGSAPEGTSIAKLHYIDRAADPKTGKLVYSSHCVRCHGAEGQGRPNVANTGYTYPPLWGAHSYNDGAGLYRLTAFAGFVKNNMPFGTSYHKPQLTDEEAWDVAAFVNSQPRPHKDQSRDWADITKKPIDFPFGPYADKFTAVQHKYGPFQPIKDGQ
jgi:thiosulfate dehydrogenase